MTSTFRRSAAPLIATIQKLFSEDLAKENDFLRQENKILRNKLGKRVPLTKADRRTLVRYGLFIKVRLAEVMTIDRPETLLAWNRRMKHQKWIFDNTPNAQADPRKQRSPKNCRCGWPRRERSVSKFRLARLDAEFPLCEVVDFVQPDGHFAARAVDFAGVALDETHPKPDSQEHGDLAVNKVPRQFPGEIDDVVVVVNTRQLVCNQKPDQSARVLSLRHRLDERKMVLLAKVSEQLHRFDPKVVASSDCDTLG
jgi:hypothetical protein